jgi:glycosyltransferase involved in cell wall biosynthesis
MSTVYVICPDSNVPYGGIKQLYRHVDVLNQRGMDACLVHGEAGFRCTWFENRTRVIGRAEMEARLGKSDYLVFPEIYGPHLTEYWPGIRKVIFNQNVHYTFCKHPIQDRSGHTPYLHPDVVATIVVSAHDAAYLRQVFPGLNLFRVRCGLDHTLFNCGPSKQDQIAFMPRKLPDDVVQVINILKFRGVLDGFELVEISNQTEREVADALQKALFFLSFSDRESFGLPPAEAMACGCVVIGYDGSGGREFLKAPYAYPVKATNLLQFSQTVERVVGLYRQHPERVREQGRQASAFMLHQYAMQRQEDDIVAAWQAIREGAWVGSRHSVASGVSP